MNHNFADWDTTILFDNTNIENRCNNYNHTIYIVIDKNNNEYIVILNDDACYSIDEYVKDYNYVDSRKAISWEDIRLYLESKGFVIGIKIVDSMYKALLKKTQSQVYSFYWEVYRIDANNEILHRQIPDITTFKTYEETRREAIKYCLSLIKESNG